MLDALFRILALTRKELLAILKDKRSRNSLFIPPIIQCLIYGYVATYDLTDVPYAVLDQSKTVESRELLARLDGSGIFHRVANLERPEQVKDYIDQRKVLLVLQIREDFDRKLTRGEPAPVQLIADGRDSNTAATATGYINAVVEAFNARWREKNGRDSTPMEIVSRTWYNPNLETRWTMIPSLIGMLTMIQTMMVTALSVAREREEGTFDQLLVSPFRPPEIMVGKALPSVIIGSVQATTILLVAQLWFRIPFAGSFFTLFFGLGVFLLAAVGIGLFISSLAVTMQQAMLFSFATIIPFALLSGLTTPIGNMPPAMQYLTLINPLRYAIDMVRRIYLEGAGLSLLIPDLWPQALLATVTLSAAAWMFRHRLT